MKPLLILLAVSLGAAAPAPAADLLAVYQRALQNDPQLREAEATRLATLEAKPQALAALLPQLSGSGLSTREHDSGSTNTTEPITTGSGQSGLASFPFDGRVSTTTHRYGLDLKQNVFNWQNWVALKRADAQVAQAEADYQAAQQDLMERVAQRYFDVLAAQDDLEAQQVALISIQRQLEQAESRYQIGLIAVTDVEEARAAHDSGAAAVIAAKRTLSSTQELLREITGDAFESLARPIEPFELASPDPVSEERWVEMALQQNLTLVSSRLAADIARENVSSARGGHFPSLDIVGSDYKAHSNGTDTFNDGTPAGGTTLDQTQRIIGLQLTFPIYAGGMVSSQVRQAVYQHRAAKERVERVARQTEHDARDSYLGVLSEISRVKALRRAVESNATSLRATESGYEAGTRTAVDVLQSRQLWVQAQTNYAHSRYDYMLNVLKLQQAAGTLSQQSLEKINSLLTDAPPPAPDPATTVR
ncbi:MAG TPA: TolC family outer membrane protein [Steroidobacteraceae bacterium]|nr:TolC family outer membrane protein [Steroidobacteraceae bacterium]